MKKFIVFFVVIMACSAVFGKYRAESKIKEALDMGIMMASGHAEVSYDDVNVNFDSSISIINLDVHEKVNFTSFRIGEINFYSSNNWRIFTSFFTPINETLTKHLFQNPDKIKLNFDEVNMRSESFSKQKYLCGLSPANTNASLNDIGYKNLNSNFSINIDASNKSLTTVDIRQSILGIAEFDMEGVINLGSGYVMNPQAFVPKTIKVGIELDETYAKKAYEHCAELNNYTKDEFLLSQLSMLEQVQDGSFSLPQESLDAFKTFMKGGSRLELVSTPKIDFSELDKLEHYKPEDRYKLLGLTANIDGKSIPNAVVDKSVASFLLAKANMDSDIYGYSDPQLAKQDVVIPEKLSTIEVVDKPVTAVETKQVSLVEEENKSGFHKVRLSELKKHVGDTISVKRKNAEDIEGTLLSYSGGLVELERRMFGGSIDYQISKKDISSVEVFY